MSFLELSAGMTRRSKNQKIRDKTLGFLWLKAFVFFENEVYFSKNHRHTEEG